MSQTLENDKQKPQGSFKDHLLFDHPDGKSEKIPVPGSEETLRVGRELDNDVVLTDPRASRYHAEVRVAAGTLEIKDLGSANGTLVGATRVEAGTWEKVPAGQTVQLGETRLSWEKASSSQTTVMVTPPQRQTAAVSTAPSAPIPQPQSTSFLPWAMVAGIVVVLLLVVGIVLIILFRSDGEALSGVAVEQPLSTPEVGAETTSIPVERTTEANLSAQTPGNAPTNTPTPTGPQLAIPVLEIVSSEVRPILLGALPSTDKALLLVNVRVQNVGNAPFKVSTDDFSVRTLAGQVLPEAGGTTSQEGLKRLGAIDRFDDLNLTPGGSVAESLIFELQAETYDLELVFQTPEVNPVVLGLGTFDAGRELALALGTPVAEETTVAAVSPTSTLEPTPTATRPPIIPAPQVVPRSALVGTIAYPIFNGTTYDIYFGDVESGETQFFRAGASQPAFSPDGSRIAFHSWSDDSRGLMTMDVSGANATLITNFVEDQLPTWTADGAEIILLSRRSGGRQSQLIKVDSSKELDEGIILGEGEYPTIGPDDQLVFKGWGITAYGLRIASSTLENIQTVSNVDEDTAPALSPDGTQVVFMSRREDNWDIYISNLDGSDLERLTTDLSDDGMPTWSPDGNAIAFVSNRGGPWAVWAMTPDGSGKRQLFTMEGSPDGFIGADTFASRGWAEERLSWTR